MKPVINFDHIQDMVKTLWVQIEALWQLVLQAKPAMQQAAMAIVSAIWPHICRSVSGESCIAAVLSSQLQSIMQIGKVYNSLVYLSRQLLVRKRSV